MHLFTRVIALSLLALPAFAQQPHLSQCIRVGNSWVTALLDTVNGQFCVSAKDGTPLLFSGEAQFTSYCSYFFNGDLYTNNNTLSAVKPRNALELPYVKSWTRGGTVGYDVTINRLGARLACTQSFTPLEERDYGYVRIVTVLRNISTDTVQAGLQLLYDLEIGAKDLVSVTVSNQPVPDEKGWDGAAMPSDFFGSTSTSPYRVRGRLEHDTLTPPDRFIVGRWAYNGFLGDAAWNCEAVEGRYFRDNATLLQWNSRPLAPGEIRTIVTDYGIVIDLPVQRVVICDSSTIHMKKLTPPDTAYTFMVSASVRNNASAGPADTVDVEILLPAKMRLFSGDVPVQRLLVGPGSTRSTFWRVAADTSFIGGPYPPIYVEYRVNGMVIARCEKIITTPWPELRINCVPPVVARDSAGTGYTPNPVLVTAKVRNVTGTPITNLRCTITLHSPELTLRSPATVVMTPGIIQPGDEGSAGWLLELPTELSRRTYYYMITLDSIGRKCHGEIDVPGVRFVSSSCTDQQTVLGREFWFAIPRPMGADKVQPDTGKPQLMIIAQERTNVRIENWETRQTIDTTLEAWDLATFTLDWSLTRHVGEQISNKSIHITATKPISVTASLDQAMLVEATTVHPSEVCGKRYMMLANNPYSHQYMGKNLEIDEFIIVGTADGTSVTVTPSDTTSTGTLPGQTIVRTLNRGEVLTIMGNGEDDNALFGSTLVADKPVAAFAASNISWILTHPAGNILYEQLPAEEDLGDTYLVLPYRARSAKTLIRLVAAFDNTGIEVNGAPQALLAKRGDMLETWIDPAPALVRGSRPFLAAQFSASGSADSVIISRGRFLGDPSMAFLVQPAAFAGCHVFFAGPYRRFYYTNGDPANGLPWDSMFVSIVAHTGSEGAIRFDGAVPSCEFQPIAGSGFSTASLKILSGFHKLETSDARGVYGLSYGFAEFDAYSTITSRTFGKGPVADAKDPVMPGGLSLSVSPNPASGMLNINFALPESSVPRLQIVDNLGRVRSTLLNEFRASGSHVARFDVSHFAPGRYWLRLESGTQVLTTSLIIGR